jgi:hypothetical protein
MYTPITNEDYYKSVDERSCVTEDDLEECRYAAVSASQHLAI